MSEIARFWKPLKNKELLCFLCYRLCKIKEGEKGYCHVRKNVDGKLYALNYGKAIAINVDPIEKKPFYHFMPGTQSFSFSTVGCNFRCSFCQNWEISQAYGGITGEDMPPEKIRRLCNEQDIPGVAYTYTEPTIFMEYALDTAKLTMEDGRYNVFVTNGYMTTAAIREMNKYIDASRIDLKGFHDNVYKDLCGDVVLEYVLSSIKELHRRQHIEIINLIIPGYNDDEDDLRAMSKWVRDLSPDIPIHFIGFFPAHRLLKVPPTQLSTLKRAREIALEEGIKYAYTGNRQDVNTESTYCPKCGEMVIKRFGFGVLENKLDKDGKCPKCGEKLNVIMDLEKYRKWKKSRMD